MVHPLVGYNHEITWIGQVYRAFTGSSILPIHELDKTAVQKPYGRIRPLPAPMDSLSLSSWSLAHAIKKADCARWRSSRILWLKKAGFLLENINLFDWSESELCLHEGMAGYYADFSASGLAGRVGQGIALLFLEDRGYAYVGRFETEWRRRAALQGKSWPKGKKKAPDFIAENKRCEWVLAESKGSFSAPDSKPNIKGALNDGLTQLDGWDQYITPQPTKSYAIGTFLREVGDTSNEASAIAFVDPEPGAPYEPVEFPTDAVRLANYASWLALMGFDDVARRLTTGTGEARRRTVPTISLAGRQFVVTIASVAPEYSDPSSQDFWDELRDWPFGVFDPFSRRIRVELVGLDLKVLRAVGAYKRVSGKSELMKLNPQERYEGLIDRDGGGFNGSIFADGSLVGALWQSRLDKSYPGFKWIELVL